MLKNGQNYTLVFEGLFLWFPLENYEKKSFLKELKFCEISENSKSIICWRFQQSISKTVESPSKSIFIFPFFTICIRLVYVIKQIKISSLRRCFNLESNSALKMCWKDILIFLKMEWWRADKINLLKLDMYEKYQYWKIC